MYLPSAQISIRVASPPANINASAAKCTTSAITARSTVAAIRLIAVIIVGLATITVAITVVITAPRTAVIAAATRRIAAFAAVIRCIIRADVGSASRTLLVFSYDVMFVNALSTEDVAADIKYLWEHTLTHSGFTQLALQTDTVLRKVVPKIGLWWEGVNQFRLLSKGTSSEDRCYICSCLFWCSGQFLGCRSRQGLAPIDG